VFVSGYGADELSSRRVPRDHGALLQKPFQAEELLRTVREVLDEGRAPVRRDDSTVTLARCLACDNIYGQLDRPSAAASGGCPRCGYIGWTGAA
jgi:hypothetical protein